MPPTHNRSWVTYIPNDNEHYAVPVQEGTVRNLCVAITPLGQGVLGWYDYVANEMRCAVVPDFDDCFTDDVVGAADVRTVWSSGTRTIWVGSLWGYNGNLYSFVSSTLTTNGKIECYIADDIENPVVWTLLGTVRDHTAPGVFASKSVREGGVPTVVDIGGRWTLPFHNFLTFAASNLEDSIGLLTSDDDGVTWVSRVSDRRGALAGGTAGPQSTTVALEPSTDDLWFGAIIGSVNQWRPYSSINQADSWADNEETNGNHNPHYYMDDGTTMYAGLLDNGAMNLYAIPPGTGDPTDPTTWTDLSMRGIITDFIDYSEGLQILPMIQADALLGVAFTARDRIAFSYLCEPVHPEPLHIPFKDRLQTLADDFTTPAIARAQDEQFDNFKTIGQWAREWMSLTESPTRCFLFVPFPDHSRQPPDISAAQSFENWKVIERWAHSISDGDCGCNCNNATEPPARCRLFVPWKDHLLNVDMEDEDQLAIAASREYDNFKALERWAQLYSSGSCGCTV